ncbi:MAG TPA: AAA family ATPase [Terracidiphilus sp.]|nr:AAA family ATPase [Terracidiphilus sp.]
MDNLTEFREYARRVGTAPENIRHLREINAVRWRIPASDFNRELAAIESDPTGAMAHFDSLDSILNAPPVEHIIQGILPKNRYTGIVALSGSRKTIVSWNIVRSCVTGEPFMGKFPVVNTPERVLFFAAESAPSEIKEKLEGMDLVPFAKSGKLAIRSAANEAKFHQDMLPGEFIKDTLIIFDTFARFYDGADEQSSTETRKFTAQMQRLVNAGASVVVLFHAPKNAKGNDLSIESIRGSGELGAGMACAWGLSMLGDTWQDNTRMEQIKKREFQCDPPRFDFSCDIPTAICSYVGEAVIGAKKRGPKKSAETQAEDATADAFILANWSMSNRAISRELMKRGIDRSEYWVRTAKQRLKPGSEHTE